MKQSLTMMRQLLLLVLGLQFCAGCGRQPSARQASSPALQTAPAAVSEGDYPLQVTDELKRSVKIAQQPQRIVSLAPKNTELLFAVGAGEQVVGVTTYCNYPPEVKQLKQVGGFTTESLSLEGIVALQPDLVLSDGKIHLPIIAELERLQIPVIALVSESVDDMYRELDLLGRITGHRQFAEEVRQGLQQRVAHVAEIAKKIPEAERVRVFYQVWEEPLTTAGPESYIGEMIALAGGKNVCEERRTRYPNVSHEFLLSADPEVILAASMDVAPLTLEGLRAKPGWNALQATRNDRIYLIEGDLVSRCAPRLVDALEIMAHDLYPQHFPGPAAEVTTASQKPQP